MKTLADLKRLPNREVVMDCGAFKNGVCAIRNTSDVSCGGDRFKCVCAVELEEIIKQLAQEWADQRAKAMRRRRRL